jgi:hypothetical protein
MNQPLPAAAVSDGHPGQPASAGRGGALAETEAQAQPPPGWAAGPHSSCSS